MRLMVCSKSTRKFAEEWKWDRIYHVHEHPTEKVLEWRNTEVNVIAIGGGSVIDTAKIISMTPIIAIPTTLSGACRTTHAVVWGENRKIDIQTPKPITLFYPEYLKGIPDDIWLDTTVDCVCHAIESKISKKKTQVSEFLASIAIEILKRKNLKNSDYLNASVLAGDAMEITGTNVIHALSYPITLRYGVPHGRALAYFLPKISEYYGIVDSIETTIVNLEIDLEMVVDDALTYPKIYGTEKPINKKILMRLLK